AMVCAVADGIAAIGHIHAQCRREGFMLGIRHRPLFVAALHFLQEHEIRTQAIQAKTQIIERLVTPEGRAPLVNVVTDNAYKRHKLNGAFYATAKGSLRCPWPG